MDLSAPAYKLLLEGDGSVVFEGKRNVSAAGVHRARISQTAVKVLAQEFVDKGYFDLSSSYGSCDDGGVVNTSLEFEGRSKAIREPCNAGPESLHELEEEIDRVSESKRWVRGRMRTFFHWPWFHSES